MSDDSVPFEKVRDAEYAAIRERRGEAPGAGRPDDLFGVALSGGGIRSASFSLGALQALHLYGLIPKIDYLSTVSGGGYIGTSMVAALTRDAEKRANAQPPSASTAEFLTFPFADDKDDGSDSADLKHLRDNSKFLAPNGFSDIGLSLAIILRGLAVNLFLLLSVMLPLATLIILSNPTTGHLDRSLISEWIPKYFPGLNDEPIWKWIHPHIIDPFIMTKVVGVICLVWLLGWGLTRSMVEFVGGTAAERLYEPTTRGAKWGRRLLIVLCVCLAAELQPVVIKFLIWLQTSPQHAFDLKAIMATASAVVATTAVFRKTLVGWVERALNSTGVAARLQGIFASIVFYSLGLALPLLLYGFFVVLVTWGIKIEPPIRYTDGHIPTEVSGYKLTPSLMRADNLSWWLIGATAALLGLSWLSGALPSSLSWKAAPSSLLKTLRPANLGFLAQYFWYQLRPPSPKPLGVIIACLLALAALSSTAAVRGADTPDEWRILANYTMLSLCVILITFFFAENSNGLHRLYRDRLQAAFQLHWAPLKPDDPMLPMGLHELSPAAPYLLVNGTLNVRRARESKAAKVDPARRGRNAEFFLFSRQFVGSDLTEYVNTERLAKAENQLDLATATAISGAAVSSSMGRVNIGLLGPTLALLNLRLGYWLVNPAQLNTWKARPRSVEGFRAKSGSGKVSPPKRSWRDYLRLYLFDEALAQLGADSSRVYITDGGHLDNLGLYQLLKRKCKFIIVIDGEADPGMNFGAFCDVQRFIRIDDGTRIELDWQPIRETVIKRQADRMKREPAETLTHLRHFAIGRVAYVSPKGQKEDEGLLLYIKAAVTGDEPDYVLDYERRNPLFPHESTGDQFFSEEQMEAYRALGFHSVKRAFDGLNIRDKSDAYKLQAELVRRLRRGLKVRTYIDDWRRRAKKPAKKKRKPPQRGAGILLPGLEQPVDLYTPVEQYD